MPKDPPKIPKIEDVSQEYIDRVTASIIGYYSRMKGDIFAERVVDLILMDVRAYPDAFYLGEKHKMTPEFTAGYIIGLVSSTVLLGIVEEEIQRKMNSSTFGTA